MKPEDIIHEAADEILRRLESPLTKEGGRKITAELIAAAINKVLSIETGPPNFIGITSLLSGIDAKGKVCIEWENKRAVLLPDEAREHAMKILGCADAAEGDEFLFHWVQTIGTDKKAAVQILREFRQYREHAVNKTKPQGGV